MASGIETPYGAYVVYICQQGRWEIWEQFPDADPASEHAAMDSWCKCNDVHCREYPGAWAELAHVDIWGQESMLIERGTLGD